MIAVYQCKEFPSDDSPPRQLYMVISESVFLLLEPGSEWKNLSTLILYANLYALERIERDLDTPNKITFYWNVQSYKVIVVLLQEHYKQELYVDKANYCISHLLAQVDKLGISSDRMIKNKYKFLENEVTDVTIKRFDIENFLEEINELEKIIAGNCSFENIQILIEKYQKVYIELKQVIEYYSALGDNKFMAYLDKMKALITKDNLQFTNDSLTSNEEKKMENLEEEKFIINDSEINLDDQKVGNEMNNTTSLISNGDNKEENELKINNEILNDEVKEGSESTVRINKEINNPEENKKEINKNKVEISKLNEENKDIEIINSEYKEHINENLIEKENEFIGNKYEEENKSTEIKDKEGSKETEDKLIKENKPETKEKLPSNTNNENINESNEKIKVKDINSISENNDKDTN